MTVSTALVFIHPATQSRADIRIDKAKVLLFPHHTPPKRKKKNPPLKTIGGETGRARWQAFILLGAGVQSQMLPQPTEPQSERGAEGGGEQMLNKLVGPTPSQTHYVRTQSYVPSWTSLFMLQYYRDLNTIPSYSEA